MRSWSIRAQQLTERRGFLRLMLQLGGGWRIEGGGFRPSGVHRTKSYNRVGCGGVSKNGAPPRGDSRSIRQGAGGICPNRVTLLPPRRRWACPGGVYRRGEKNPGKGGGEKR